MTGRLHRLAAHLRGQGTSTVVDPSCRSGWTVPRSLLPAWPARGRWVAGVLVAVALCGQPGPAGAQAADADALHAERLRPDERLPLDGSLSHPAWQRAPVHERFVEKFPVNGKPPSHETRVRVLFDEQALYVGVEALDPDPSQLRAPLVRHDGVNRTQDFVAVYVDAIGSRQSAQFFRVNAAGSLADGMHTAADDHEDFSPDFDYDAATARNPQGWTAVLRIPFASLRFTSQHGAGDVQPWRILVVRRVPREQAAMHTSVLVPRDAPNFLATMQPLRGVRLPDSHQFLTLRPSLTLRTQRQQPAGEPALRRSEVAASLDLKWRPLHELVVDATLNPDFSQVALDVPQLAGNTRFALQYPETRPFFFEASDLLRSPSDAIYTRSFTEPRWGLRGTWRGARLAGSAIALDDRGGGLVLVPGAFGTDAVAQPGSQALLARLRGDGDALQWGLLAAERRYAGDRGHNAVAGPDITWQFGTAWRLRAQWLGADTTAHPDAGGQLQRGDAQRSQRALAKLYYQTGEVEGEFLLDVVGSRFRDDTGFVAQNGVQHVFARVGRGWQALGPFNDFWLNFEAEQVHQRETGVLVSRDWRPGVWLTAPGNLEAWLYLHGLVPGSTAQRTGADAPRLDERYLKAGLSLTPATWLPLLSSELTWGQVADVAAQRVRHGGNASLSLNTRLLPRLELEPALNWGWLQQDGQRHYTEAGHQLLARWHFSARHTLRAIVQYTALDRRAETAANGLPVDPLRERGTTGSLTWAWRQSAGTVMYLGWSNLRERSAAVAGTSRGAEAFIKLQVDVDEARRALF